MKYYKNLQEVLNNKNKTDIIIAQDISNNSAKNIVFLIIINL